MGWTETDPDDPGVVAEWERTDGCATIRLRRRRDGWVVRLDRLTQAPEGSLYLDDRVDTQEAAVRVAETWRETYDVDASADTDAGAGTDTDADVDV